MLQEILDHAKMQKMMNEIRAVADAADVSQRRSPPRLRQTSFVDLGISGTTTRRPISHSAYQATARGAAKCRTPPARPHRRPRTATCAAPPMSHFGAEQARIQTDYTAQSNQRKIDQGVDIDRHRRSVPDFEDDFGDDSQRHHGKTHAHGAPARRQ